MCMPIVNPAVRLAEEQCVATALRSKFSLCSPFYISPAYCAHMCSHFLTFFQHGYEALLFRTQTKRTNRKESSGRDVPEDLVSLANARRSHFVRTDLGDEELDAGHAANRRLQLQAITDRNEVLLGFRVGYIGVGYRV
jgi:hypothetical protein